MTDIGNCCSYCGEVYRPAELKRWADNPKARAKQAGQCDTCRYEDEEERKADLTP